jgi:hypothetical protein
VKASAGQTHYEVLEVPRTATPQEVQRAYDRIRSLLGPGSLASYTLLDPEEAAEFHQRLEKARAVLLDPGARAAYDATLPGGEVRPRPAPGAPAGAQGPLPGAALQVPEGTEWTGELLRRAREARSLTTQQLAERTKVQRTFIEDAEADRLDRLPPSVYLRGNVHIVATVLGLDAANVVASYLAHVARLREAAARR